MLQNMQYQKMCNVDNMCYRENIKDNLVKTLKWMYFAYVI